MFPRRALMLLAACALGAPIARAMPLEAVYAVSQAGVTVMEVELTLDMTEGRYRLVSVSRARGIGRLFLPAEQRAEAEGRLAGREVQPARYLAEGEWRGTPRRTLLEFAGATPRPVVLEPPEGPDRIPVPPEAREGAIDTLSALVRLSRDAAATGRCDLTGAVFDGRRKMEWSSRTIGTDAPPLRGITGEALRCRLESRLVGGFRRGDDPARAGRPREADAWIATLGPGQPPMPLRVEFPSTFLGAFRLDLVRINRSGP
ncbi:DUF3108 domain-containing protein [Roseomonas alkaliterrae]|uniref:DUF3108 domain-containing protein n=1 Tax=Neoroseomonas alkaliterrae TaxID=1452450 RepID=A0A840Y871_9PROT|nr:DUF3108 domain-containing protein [Neoroseomonas alkaliterrae]MBB5690243.1 hypothetical protein [Neoroseomonas alkaliterrae]MBR0676518.1 DUF3108 domain-containing protein [Neoroseomonas alkaliterrae]